MNKYIIKIYINFVKILKFTLFGLSEEARFEAQT